MDLSLRSYEKELLDRDDIPFEDIRRNMQELDFINRWLGGHRITLQGLKPFLSSAKKQRKFSVCEVGCGGGDNLRVIKNYAKQKKLNVELTGIDINPHCISFARNRPEMGEMNFICSDFRQVSFSYKPHVIFSSLFCHHFANEEVKNIFLWMKENSLFGFFMNDLHRHQLAYYSIKWLTKFFSKSYLVKNDAALSVKRGFNKKELEECMQLAGLPNFQLKWKWAFRWLLVYKHSTK
ncbi:MAG: SAM-dependent methyltransferase [Chitinophagaceae bacterium]